MGKSDSSKEAIVGNEAQKHSISTFLIFIGFRKECLGFGVMLLTRMFRLLRFGLEKIYLWVAYAPKKLG